MVFTLAKMTGWDIETILNIPLSMVYQLEHCEMFTKPHLKLRRVGTKSSIREEFDKMIWHKE